MDVNSGDESAAEKLSEAQEECRNLSTLQSAVNGGLALGPAAYGRTYLSVFGFLTPFLFKNCSTNSGFKPTKIKEETLDSIRSTIKTMQRDYSAQDGH
jgi:hypothetical protein